MNVAQLRSLPGRVKKGFTLVELMIVVAIVALLVALAVPAFSKYVRKAKRAEAQQLLMNWANNQEIWRATHTTYAASGSAIGVPTHDNYTFYVRATGTTCANETPTATNYVVLACATGTQATLDTDYSGTACTPLSLTETGTRGPTASCWGKN